MVLNQKTAKNRLMEEKLYKKISDEKKVGYRRDGLWLKALSESNNDECKAESLYVTLRLQSIIDEEIVCAAQERQERIEREAQIEQQRSEIEKQEQGCYPELFTGSMILLLLLWVLVF